ncbi:MAG: endonuclease MutS2 [Clostridia bacterium]|nr:endonuclease MutS2 [Clostridia bacterium]NCC43610.1 endonuclease MutS2 [Clostridia bacterium]
MNKKALSTLEYDKIIEMLVSHASSPLGKIRCEDLQPSNSIGEIEYHQKQTQDALTRLFQKGNISFGSVKDVRGSLKRLEIGSTLSIIELLSICSLLENTSRVKSYGRRERDDTPADSLTELFDSLEPLPLLTAEVRRCILSEEEISDDASSNLRQIRRSMKIAGDRIHTQLASMVNGSARTYLQDAVITMRNGRYCIPVKSEYKGQVPGMVHDQSSTGATLFIEPLAIVKLNNDIRDLELKEAAEIEVILSSLSELTAQNREAIQYNLENLVELDFIFARAALAMDQRATRPIFNTNGFLNIRKGRHPLIDKNKVVPIDIHLGKDFHLLIVTGPNTGGKTVSLKTVGLLTLMGQSGLHIPALDRSELAVFDEVYADIGDEQSIEQSLSTFSSHMTNVVSFIEKADTKSLVLFDELGAGTDPTEGAALAIAILNQLQKQGIRAMATTHYSELKVYALSTPGVENASCEFDVETLRPTYRLLIGIPGKSNAFAISSKLGLPSYIIDEAKKQISTQDESFEDVISTLEQNRVTIEKERLEIAQYKSEITALKDQLEAKKEKLDQRKAKILQDANEEAHAILREAKEYADQTMKNFNKFGKANVSASEMEAERQRLRQKMNKVEKNISMKTKAQQPTSTLKPSDLHLGDGVKVLSLNLKGTVSTLPDSKGFLFVQMGIMRSKIHITDLVLMQDEAVITSPSMTKTNTGKIKMSKSASVGIEINLLGKTVDEAIAELDKYLDDAYLAHIPSVRIVHGKGTGALRKGVHNYLRRVKYVSSYRLGEFGEGDAGVTIVEFKK